VLEELDSNDLLLRQQAGDMSGGRKQLLIVGLNFPFEDEDLDLVAEVVYLKVQVVKMFGAALDLAMYRFESESVGGVMAVEDR